LLLGPHFCRLSGYTFVASRATLKSPIWLYLHYFLGHTLVAFQATPGDAF